MSAAKTKFKRVVQKAADITGDLVGNRIADKITLGKPKNKTKEEDNETNETQETRILPEKRQQRIYDLRLF